MHSPRLLLGLLLGANWADSPPTGKAGRVRGKWVIALLAVGILLDLLISAALLYQNHQIEQNASEAHILKVAGYEACLASNQAKLADLDRWEKVLTLLDSGPANPAVRQFVAGVRAANKAADHPVDCKPLVP